MITYVYIYLLSIVRGHSVTWQRFLADISAEIYTLVYFALDLILLMFKSHDKYQSYILAGLGHTEKAKFENRSIFVINRSYWREWRPLVTPWADGIKEGTEPWKCQKRSFLSHVLVSPLSLLSPSSLAMFLFCLLLLLLLLLLFL